MLLDLWESFTILDFTAEKTARFFFGIFLSASESLEFNAALLCSFFECKFAMNNIKIEELVKEFSVLSARKEGLKGYL